MKNKELIGLLMVGLVLVFFGTIFEFGSVYSSLKFAIVFNFLFYWPVLFFVAAMKELDLTDKLAYTLIFGLSYGFVYFILDVVFGIPLTKTLFMIFSGGLILIGFYNFFFNFFYKVLKIS